MVKPSESIGDIGKIFDGEPFVADVRYDIRTYRNCIPGASTTASIECHLGSPSALPSGQYMTVHLRDGRKLDVLVTSEGGECVVAGPLY